MSILAALGVGGWALAMVVAVLVVGGLTVLAGVLFVPGGEPTARAERLLRAWRGGGGKADEHESTSWGRAWGRPGRRERGADRGGAGGPARRRTPPGRTAGRPASRCWR